LDGGTTVGLARPSPMGTGGPSRRVLAQYRGPISYCLEGNLRNSHPWRGNLAAVLGRTLDVVTADPATAVPASPQVMVRTRPWGQPCAGSTDRWAEPGRGSWRRWRSLGRNSGHVLVDLTDVRVDFQARRSVQPAGGGSQPARHR
jgi:hypothetical protein